MLEPVNGNEILPFETKELTELFRRKAEVELFDTPRRRAEGLAEIKEMAKNELRLSFHDDFLLLFLRTRKFDVARAFSQLKAFVQFKKSNSDLFDFRFENVIKTVTYGVASILPYRCRDGCTILLVEGKHWRPELFPFEEYKQMYLLVLMQAARDIMTQVNGFKVIIDFTTDVRQIRYCTPQNLYLLFHATQHCIPGRYKGIHFINNSLVFKPFWLATKLFLTEKLKKRIFFHSSKETLMDYFPKDVLPVQYGGTLENYDMTAWLRKVTQPEELEVILGRETPEGS